MKGFIKTMKVVEENFYYFILSKNEYSRLEVARKPNISIELLIHLSNDKNVECPRCCGWQ